MAKEYKVIHKKSNVMIEGSPKLPAAASLEYGELAINYANGGETLSIKNSNDEIVTFSSDKAQVQSDWNEANSGSTAYIKNKPTIPEGLPAVTSSDNGKVLTVVNGVWTPALPTIIYTGNGTPLSELGNEGDIYLQTS
ncbi:MAG: hypothetical protein J6X18_04380 [Bacteroidales bacterium]|nr:hypothetical protein [Bacteroidales bacterium]